MKFLHQFHFNNIAEKEEIQTMNLLASNYKRKLKVRFLFFESSTPERWERSLA